MQILDIFLPELEDSYQKTHLPSYSLKHRKALFILIMGFFSLVTDCKICFLRKSKS